MSTLPPTRISAPLRLSVFVDADNIAAGHADTIFALACRHGAPDMIRAYGNARKLSAWDELPGFHMIHSGTGKNAADMLICLDAMERALTEDCDAVLLVSSDQDFTHLATRLRERGLTVIGAGEAKTPERFSKACSLFHVLESRTACASDKAPDAPRPEKTLDHDPTELDHKIRDVIRSDCTDKAGLEIRLLAMRMFKSHGVKISAQPEKTWRAYLAKRPSLYTLDPRGPDAKVRYLPGAFRSLTS